MIEFTKSDLARMQQLLRVLANTAIIDEVAEIALAEITAMIDEAGDIGD